jgi:hypothetical protein
MATARHFPPGTLPDSDAINAAAAKEGNLESPPTGALVEHALHLRDAIVARVWDAAAGTATSLGGSPAGLHGPFVYTGLGGVAMLLWRSYAVDRRTAVLSTCLEMVAAAVHETDASASAHQPAVTFVMGLPGLFALGAVAAQQAGHAALRDHYIGRLTTFSATNAVAAASLPSELLYGRAGFLWACSFLNVGCPGAVPDCVTSPVVAAILRDGRHGGAAHGACPLMYTWHGTPYTGAAHGLAGICHVLLHYREALGEAGLRDVAGTLRYLVNTRYASGNYPSHDGASEHHDRLVQWCHGAPGMVLTLSHAYAVLGEDWLLQAARQAGEVVWRRGLLRKAGLCHGVAGNAYAFLALRRAELLAAARGAAGGGAVATACGAPSARTDGAHGGDGGASHAQHWQAAGDAVGSEGEGRRRAGASGRAAAGTSLAAAAPGSSVVAAADMNLYRARQFAQFLVFGPSQVGASTENTGVGDGDGAGSRGSHSGRAHNRLAAGAPPLGQAHWQQLVANGAMHGGDNPLSLYEGAAGVAYALLDIHTASGIPAATGAGNSNGAAFPGYELPVAR